MSNVIQRPLAELGKSWNVELTSRKQLHLPANYPKLEKRYRPLTDGEIAILLKNNNHAADWNNIWVSDIFNPEQIKNSSFYGVVKIGDIPPHYLDYRDLQLPCGIYHSCLINSIVGDNNAIHHVRYMANFITGDNVILSNINEMETSYNAKFGNGILKQGEDEDKRIWIELCNENGGRAILPFTGMQAADAFLWTRYRHDDILQNKLVEITENPFSKEGGFFSEIGNNAVIKNSNMIKDVIIGDHTYIKGVNKLKNVTIHSTREAYTQIGEGCEIVNGIIGYGCRIFYGVKAVRFILSSFSQLKYGARLINSFLGDNSTISCCEVLNSLLFPAHEQHHNNSFLCAALVMGQSNMAAGATIGSNHNSRAADGEIIARRGFWPGLCVSLKHNSYFASYTLIVKGDFLHELNIKIPFSLISNDVKNDRLIIVPAYWFLYNMYAIMRNNHKFIARDKRTIKNQYIEYDILAPDTINEMFDSLNIVEEAVMQSLSLDNLHNARHLLKDEKQQILQDVYMQNVECSKRKVVLLKPKEGYNLFKRLIRHYGTQQLVDLLFHLPENRIDLQEIVHHQSAERKQFENIGGQLVPKEDLHSLLQNIKNGTLQDWNSIHQEYHKWSKNYLKEKRMHALASLAEITETPIPFWNNAFIKNLITESIYTQKWIFEEIYNSRRKDYANPFRQMVYEDTAEMDKVVGKLKDNSFIQKEKKTLEDYIAKAEKVLQKL